MNFKEWFENFENNLYSIPDNKVFSRKAWKACKNEVLKILNENTRKDPYDGRKSIYIDVIKEIKKL
ncbi:MAG TPA: hypothetical protein VMZ91_02335 [Candidatus Paceibacterota bacterium]|nr:hypothetical protein [Candidatus Paceibacterota bacterium]